MKEASHKAASVNLTDAQRKRYTELFAKLDSNKDGKLDVNDLIAVFERNSLNNCQENNMNRAKVSLLLILFHCDLFTFLTITEATFY
jgi:Ca2+-binding EF-hand superfamily protein